MTDLGRDLQVIICILVCFSHNWWRRELSSGNSICSEFLLHLLVALVGDASDASIALCFGVAGRVGVEGKPRYEVSAGVGVEGGTVTVVAELLKKVNTDNCLCILMVL